MRAGRTRSRWNSPTIRIPLSESVFKNWSRRENIHVKARGVAIFLAVVGVLITFRAALPGIGILAVAIVVHLIDLWAERTARAFRPDLVRSGSTIEFHRVHDDFAEALVEMGGERLSVS